jgi:hypothetical protein
MGDLGPPSYIGDAIRFVADCKRRSNNPSLKRPGIPVAPE